MDSAQSSRVHFEDTAMTDRRFLWSGS